MSLLLEWVVSLRGKAKMSILTIDPLIAAGVVLATALTDAAYVMFTSAVIARKRVPAASWSSIWYLLSSFAVISYTNNWICLLRRVRVVDRRLRFYDLPASAGTRGAGRLGAAIAKV
jgi:hypothetical protein